MKQIFDVHSGAIFDIGAATAWYEFTTIYRRIELNANIKPTKLPMNMNIVLLGDEDTK